MNLIKELKARRIALGISQTELAKRTGMLQCNIARLEAEKMPPKLATVEAIAQALGCSLTLVEA